MAGWDLWQKPYSLEKYSTPRAKTDKLEEPVNRELNVTRSWNFIQVQYYPYIKVSKGPPNVVSYIRLTLYEGFWK